MKQEFFQGNRERLYSQMKENSLLALFSGTEVRKTNDEFYPFYTNRSFLYLTGLDGKELALLARKDGQGRVTEKIFLLPRTCWRSGGPAAESSPTRRRSGPASSRSASRTTSRRSSTGWRPAAITSTCTWTSTGRTPLTGMPPPTVC